MVNVKTYKDVELLRIRVTSIDYQWTKKIFTIQKTDYEKVAEFLDKIEEDAFIK